MELLASSVVFLAYGTPHATVPNTADHEHAGVALHFLRADHAQGELIAPDRDYRPYLTGPQGTSGLRECGEVVAGRGSARWSGRWRNDTRTSGMRGTRGRSHGMINCK